MVTTIIPKDTIHIAVEPFGIPAAQHWYHIPAYFEVIRAYGVETFVEVGSFRGGLLTFIGCRALFRPTFRYLGIENNTPEIDAKWKLLSQVTEGRVCTWTEDAHLPGTIAGVGRYIRLSRAPAFILCDGYNKDIELTLYSPILRPGDVIAAHDSGVEFSDDAYDCLRGNFTELRPELFRDVCSVPMWRRV